MNRELLSQKNDIKRCKQILSINILGKRINFFGFKYQQCEEKFILFNFYRYNNLKKKLRNILNDKFNYVKRNKDIFN